MQLSVKFNKQGIFYNVDTMPPGQIEQDDKMLYCTSDIQYQWYISDIPVIYQWLSKGRIDKMSVVLLTRTYVTKQQWKKTRGP